MLGHVQLISLSHTRDSLTRFCDFQVFAMKLEYEGAELHLEKKPEYVARKKSERSKEKPAAEGDSDGEEAAEGDVAPAGQGGKNNKRGREGAAKDGQGGAAAGKKKAKGEEGAAADEAGAAAEGEEKKGKFVPGAKFEGVLQLPLIDTHLSQ